MSAPSVFPGVVPPSQLSIVSENAVAGLQDVVAVHALPPGETNPPHSCDHPLAMASSDRRPSIDVAAILADRAGDAADLHSRYLNRQMVRVLKTIGFDRDWVAGEGAYLIDSKGDRYLD